MASVPSVVTMSVEQYLRTPFQPDVDYVDGVIEERNLGERDHARLQGLLYSLLTVHEAAWEIEVLPEQRVQVSAWRFRVPDICVVDARGPVEQIVRTPPLLCLEVVSPEDRLPRLLDRARDFHTMGVAEVWLFDPERRKVWISVLESVREWQGGVLRLEGTQIELDPADAFARLDRRR